MQFNLVNDQEQVAQFVRRGVAWRGVAGRGVSVRACCGGVPEAFCSAGFYWAVRCLPRAFSGSSSGQRLLCVLDMRLCMASWLWLGSAFSVVAFVCFLVFPLPIRGGRGFSSIVSPLNVLFSVTVLDLGSGVTGGARGWVAGRAGLWGCPTDLGLACWGQSPDP